MSKQSVGLQLFSILLIINTSVWAQQKAYKFDFGTTATTKGYTVVTPKTIYTDIAGYGFINTSAIIAVERNKKNTLTSDFITSSKPFFFSVKIPEGNYEVKIILGDINGISATTVRAECRRLFLQNIETKKTEIKTEYFTVHVKDSIIRDAIGNAIDKVKLKTREINYLHWDNQLTLEFNDSAVKICAVEITPNTTATTIFLAGNSTVVENPGQLGGKCFLFFFRPEKLQ